MNTKLLASVFLIAAGHASVALAADAPTSTAASVEDQARFLAGLPVSPGSPLAAIEERDEWKKHRDDLGSRWEKLASNRLVPMTKWAESEIWPRIDPKRPMLYYFGGPDAITVDVLYPDAPITILMGLERLGNVPRLETLPPKELERGLTNLRTLLRSTIDSSFFVTDTMNKEMQRTQIRGVLPILYLFLARNGERVLATDRIFVDKDGHEQPGEAPNDGVPGWRIQIQREGHPARLLYYFSQDATDSALPKRPGMMPFLAAKGPYNAFLKAASFILHDKHFSETKKLLLESSASILQDDSGMPFHALDNDAWERVLFGQYTPLAKVFRDHFQPDMAKAFEHGSRPLPFTTGYRHEAGSSNLVLALSKTLNHAGTAASGTPSP